METLTKKKKNYCLGIWRVIYPLGLYFVINTIVQLPFIVVYTASAFQEGNGDIVKMQEILMQKIMQNTLPIMIIAIAITLPIVIFLMIRDKKKREAEFGIIHYTKAKIAQWVFVGILAIAYCIFANSIITLSNIITIFPGYEAVAKSIYSGGFFMELLVVGVMAPIMEEMLFRGLAHNRIKEYSNAKIAIILSALLFGVYHLNVIQGLYAFGFGLLLAFVYEKFHTLWAPILLHAAANTASVFLTEIEGLAKIFENKMIMIGLIIVCGIILAAILYQFSKMHQEEHMEESEILPTE